MHCLEMPILKSELVLKVGYTRQREHAGQEEGPVICKQCRIHVCKQLHVSMCLGVLFQNCVYHIT